MSLCTCVTLKKLQNQNMLYKKYVIEIVKEVEMVYDTILNTSSVYDNNQVQLSLSSVKNPINVIMFLGVGGSLLDFPTIYETHEKAYDILSTHYYSLKSDYKILTMSVKEVYDDTIPPIEVLRSMKIKQILK